MQRLLSRLKAPAQPKEPAVTASGPSRSRKLLSLLPSLKRASKQPGVSLASSNILDGPFKVRC